MSDTLWNAIINICGMLLIFILTKESNDKRDEFEYNRHKSEVEREAFIIYTSLTNSPGSDMNKTIIKIIEDIENNGYKSLWPMYQPLLMTSSEVRNKIKELCANCLKYQEDNKLY